MVGTTYSKSNPGIEGISYYVPKSDILPGTVINKIDDDKLPYAFRPIKIRDLQIRNRLWMSPMCMYSARDGAPTDWHVMHYGEMAERGVSLILVEATGVSPEGRITPQCLGLWNETQLEGHKRIVEIVKSQGAVPAIQLAHAGRKASTAPPFRGMHALDEEHDGWPSDVIAPSAIPYDQYYTPRAMTKEDIETFKKNFVNSVKLALRAGYQAIEIHSAHGYLLHEFISPVSNQRTDEYGGSFENRTRLVLEIARLARAQMPEGMPLFLRISGSDNAPEDIESWKSEDTVRLAPLLFAEGVDLLDVSASGNVSTAPLFKPGPGYQLPLAAAVKESRASGIIVASVGGYANGKFIEQTLESQECDVCLIGRQLLYDPKLIHTIGKALGCELAFPIQYHLGTKDRS